MQSVKLIIAPNEIGLPTYTGRPEEVLVHPSLNICVPLDEEAINAMVQYPVFPVFREHLLARVEAAVEAFKTSPTEEVT